MLKYSRLAVAPSLRAEVFEPLSDPVQLSLSFRWVPRQQAARLAPALAALHVMRASNCDVSVGYRPSKLYATTTTTRERPRAQQLSADRYSMWFLVFNRLRIIQRNDTAEWNDTALALAGSRVVS